MLPRAAIAALALALWSGPVAADTRPVLSLSAGRDRLVATSDQILAVQVRTSGFFPDVLVTLDPALRPDLAALSKAHVGERITVRVCGVIVSEPTMTAPINSNEFAVSLPNAAEARHLAAVFQAKDCQAESS